MYKHISFIVVNNVTQASIELSTVGLCSKGINSSGIYIDTNEDGNDGCFSTPDTGMLC